MEHQQIIATAWIENLAIEEINMEESGVVHFNDHLDPSVLLEESSIEVMNLVREKFEIYVTKFNEFRGDINSASQIKVFKISNTVNDFMLFRSSLRMVVSRKSPGLIQIGFLSNSGGMFSARPNISTPPMNVAHEIHAHMGPFNKIHWQFGGEEVDFDSMVKHYLTEFVRYSAR